MWTKYEWDFAMSKMKEAKERENSIASPEKQVVKVIPQTFQNC